MTQPSTPPLGAIDGVATPVFIRLSMSDFKDLGGEPVLRPLIHEFVDRMFDDVMIGFFFSQANRERIKKFEYQHAAAHLGGDVQYEGRALRDAHAAHRIFGGQFERRKHILRKVLETGGIDTGIQQRWFAHLETLRPLITTDAGSECSELSES